MPALTRNRRFARSRNSSERAGTPAGAGSIQTVEASGAEPGQFLSDPAPCARSAGGVVSEGPTRVASRSPPAKGTPYGKPLQGASRTARTRGRHSRQLGLRRRLRGHRRCGYEHPTSPARRAMARQPDSPQRRLPRELRFGRRDRHRVRRDRDASGRYRPGRIERGRRVSQDQDRRQGAERGPGRAGRARRIHHGGGRDRAEPAHVRWIGGEEQSREAPPRYRTHHGGRRGPVRRAGPDLRRCLPGRVGAFGAGGGPHPEDRPAHRRARSRG